MKITIEAYPEENALSIVQSIDKKLREIFPMRCKEYSFPIHIKYKVEREYPKCRPHDIEICYEEKV